MSIFWMVCEGVFVSSRLYNQNVLLRCLVYGFLELLVEVVDLTVIMTRCWCINLYDGDIERSCSQADWYQSAGDWSAS